MQAAAYRRRLVPTKTPGIYRRGSRYVVRYRDPTGRARKQSARTMAEARRIKAEVNADVGRGEWRAQSRVSFADHARDWIGSYQGRTARGLRDETREDYRVRLERDAIPFFGRRRLAEIEPRDVKRFAAHVASRGVGPNTVRLAVAPVKALFATAVEEGLIRSNPTLGVRIARRTAETEQERVKVMTEEELGRFLTAVDPYWRTFFSFLAATGFRMAAPLTWGDLDFGQRRVSVTKRIYRGKLGPPKSRYGVRTLQFEPELARDLWALRKQRRGDGDLVFVTPTGRPLDQSALTSRVLKPAARAAGVPWVSFHTFRHTHATILFQRGWNAKQVQIRLGHHSPAFTMAVYVHLMPDDLPETDFFDALTAAPAEEEPAALPAAAGEVV